MSFSLFHLFLIFSKCFLQIATKEFKMPRNLKDFDIQPFLDPVIQQEMPIPLPSNNIQTKGKVRTRVAVVEPPGIETIHGTNRQLISIAPTTAFIVRRSFNTSCAFTIPLFTFTLPTTAVTGSPVFMANQFVYGLFGVILTLSCFVVPVLFSGIRDPTLEGRSNVGQTQEILDRLMSPHPVVDLMGTDTKYKIGLDSSKCLLKTICEAQRAPQNKEYGLLAIPFQIFFPPPQNETSELNTSAAQIAARIGKYENQKCGDVYNCFFDVLDLAVYMRDLFYPKHGFEDGETS